MFPILKNAVILQIMQEVNVPLTEMELTEPGRCKERIREVFVQLLNICMGYDDDANSPLFALPRRLIERRDRLSHPIIYDDALSETKFYSLLSRQMRICGYREFGFRDLACPQARRLRRQLSALINFLKYREDMGHLEMQALEEREELFAALDEVTENHMTLRDQLDEARAINRDRQMELEEAELECKEMEAEIAQQNKIQASIRQETYSLKKSANELQDQIANISIALRELKAEERRLSKEVVHSPDRIRLDLADATRELEGVRKALSDAQAEASDYRKRAERASEAEEGVVRIASVMEEMDVALQDNEMAAEDSEQAQDTSRRMEQDRERTMEEMIALEKKLDDAEKRKADATSSLVDVLRTVQDEFDAAVARLGTVESEVVECTARIESSERRVEEMRKLIETRRARAEEDAAYRVESFRKYENQFWAREEGLRSQLGY